MELGSGTDPGFYKDNFNTVRYRVPRYRYTYTGTFIWDNKNLKCNFLARKIRIKIRFSDPYPRDITNADPGS